MRINFCLKIRVVDAYGFIRRKALIRKDFAGVTYFMPNNFRINGIEIPILETCHDLDTDTLEIKSVLELTDTDEYEATIGHLITNQWDRVDSCDYYINRRK